MLIFFVEYPKYRVIDSKKRPGPPWKPGYTPARKYEDNRSQTVKERRKGEMGYRYQLERDKQIMHRQEEVSVPWNN